MGFKKSKVQDAAYTPAKSVFSGFTGARSNLAGFTTAKTSREKGGIYNTEASLSPGLQGSLDSASSGLLANNDYLGQSPDQQFAALEAGNNAYYNSQLAQLQRNWAMDAGNQQLGFSGRGMENSTARGGYLGQLAGDYALRDYALRAQALDYMNNQARQNAASQLQTLNGLYGFIAPNAGLANQNYMEGLGALDQMTLANKQLETQTALANLQSRQQEAQRRGSLLGNLIGGAATVGAAALSDKRLKRNIKRIGKLTNDLNLYEYNYLWSDDKTIGVMAQEVERVLPQAVLPIGGTNFKAVDYKQVSDYIKKEAA